VGHIKNAYRLLIRNMKGRDHMGDKGRWKGDIKIDYKCRGFKGCRVNSGTARGGIFLNT
jgi:hypothetical protein